AGACEARARRACILGRQRTALGRHVLRAPAREEQRQLLARQARPRAHAGGVDMHERDCGERVVADAAALTDECRIAQALDGYVGKVDVGGLTVDVLAFLRLSATRLAEHAVRAARAIAGDDMDRHLRAKLVVYLPEEIDELG